MKSSFCVLRFVCSKHTKMKPDAQDTPTDDAIKSPRTLQILLLLIKLPSPHIKNGAKEKMYETLDVLY